jgi:hypothetical protein
MSSSLRASPSGQLDQRDLHRVAEKNRPASLPDLLEVVAQARAEEERPVVIEEHASGFASSAARRCMPSSSSFTTMRFWVSVPVLSVQITVVEPNVSTDDKCRIRTFRFAMRWLASTSASVSVGSRPSGTMATMMPMAKTNAFQNGTPAKRPTTKKRSPIPTATIPITRLRCAISLRSGETASPAVCVRWAILPNSVYAGREDDCPGLAGNERRACEHDVAAVNDLAAIDGACQAPSGHRLR